MGFSCLCVSYHATCPQVVKVGKVKISWDADISVLKIADPVCPYESMEIKVKGKRFTESTL